jgi:hypothetical protein
MPPTLEYAPPPRLRGRVVRLSGMVLGLFALLVCAAKYGPKAYDRLRYTYWENRCMTFTAPPGTIVYQRVPAGSNVTIPPGYVNADSVKFPHLMQAIQRIYQAPTEVEFRFAPRVWAEFMGVAHDCFPIDPGDPIVFCHALQSPAGHRRLVTLGLERGFDIGDMLPVAFHAAVYDNDSEITNSEAGFSYSGQSLDFPVLIEAGQPDLTAPSHFTIAYQWRDGLRGTLDGRLQDDDAVKLTVRPGPGDIDSEWLQFRAKH